jgi:hypothetical protein
MPRTSSDRELLAEVDRLGIQQRFAAIKGGFSGTMFTLTKSGQRRLSSKHRLQLETYLMKVKTVIAAHPGVQLDMKNTDFEAEFAKMEGDRQTEIPQEWAIEFGLTWGQKFGFTTAETFAMPQFHLRVMRATIMSQPAQKWFRAYTAAIETILAGRNFSEYAATFSDRHTAVTAIANAAFAALVGKCGKAKILEYLSALLATGEIRQAPRDVSEN